MSENETADVLTPQPPKLNPQVLAAEEKLWGALLADLGNEQLHKDYVGFVLKNNLIKQATRRYGPVIEDKEKHSIEARRLARQYQKSLVDLLFFTPKHETIKRSTSLEGFVIFFVVILFFIGVSTFLVDVSNISAILIFILRSLVPISLGALIIYFWIRFSKAKDYLDKE